MEQVILLGGRTVFEEGTRTIFLIIKKSGCIAVTEIEVASDRLLAKMKKIECAQVAK
jgi:hypothetical protein